MPGFRSKTTWDEVSTLYDLDPKEIRVGKSHPSTWNWYYAAGCTVNQAKNLGKAPETRARNLLKQTFMVTVQGRIGGRIVFERRIAAKGAETCFPQVSPEVHRSFERGFKMV